jgi:hypothetical protein
MPLELSGYVTRSGRRVVLKGSEKRPIRQADGSNIDAEIFRGDLFKADGKTVDSEHEWMNTLRNGVLGEHVNQNSSFQVASEYDLVQHIGL